MQRALKFTQAQLAGLLEMRHASASCALSHLSSQLSPTDRTVSRITRDCKQSKLISPFNSRRKHIPAKRDFLNQEACDPVASYHVSGTQHIFDSAALCETRLYVRLVD